LKFTLEKLLRHGYYTGETNNICEANTIKIQGNQQICVEWMAVKFVLGTGWLISEIIQKP
jgi:hypothetical protein